jgi:alpha-galactosidase
MGWNSWNRFACNVTEDLVKSAADALVTSGMKDAGYEYVVIDDCWQISRDAAGNIVADAKTFPSGIKALADLRPLQGSEIRHLFRCWHENLRGPPRQPGT